MSEEQTFSRFWKPLPLFRYCDRTSNFAGFFQF